MTNITKKLPKLVNSSMYQKIAIVGVFLLFIFIIMIYILNQLELDTVNCQKITDDNIIRDYHGVSNSIIDDTNNLFDANKDVEINQGDSGSKQNEFYNNIQTILAKDILGEENYSIISDNYIRRNPYNNKTELQIYSDIGKLKHYYIKSAFNCCCSGEYKNDYVNICALENCINHGVRFLDFEIYSIDDKPCISASVSSNSAYYKETYNHINLEKALRKIKLQALIPNNDCNNVNDPLFLFFRINSFKKDIFNEIYYALNNAISENINTDYTVDLVTGNSENNLQKSLIDENILDLCSDSSGQVKPKRVFVGILFNSQIPGRSTNDFKTNLENSLLYKNKFLSFVAKNGEDTQLTNPIFTLKRYEDLLSTKASVDNEKNETKKSMSIVIPNINKSSTNNSISIPWISGCQFILMKYQNNDSYLKYYNDKFITYAFQEKPQLYRNIKYVIPEINKDNYDACTEPDTTKVPVSVKAAAYNEDMGNGIFGLGCKQYE